ncbi:MAG: hypothetical protein V7700_09835, partial [Halioglobus sp.]
MKLVWRLLLSLLLLLFAAFLLAVSTEFGSGTLLRSIDRFTALEIDYADGRISGRLRLNQLSLTTQGTTIKLRDVVADFTPACIWRSLICFEQLQVASLSIAVLPGADDVSPQAPPDVAATDSELIVFPFALQIDKLAVSSTHITWQDGEWRQGLAQAQLRISDSTIAVSAALFTDAYLELREAPVAVEKTGKIELPRIDLPFDLKVAALELQRPSSNFYGSKYEFQHMAIEGSWRNTQLAMTRLDVDGGAVGTLALQGALQFAGDWPLQASLDASVAQPEVWPGLHGRQLGLSAAGSLALLSLEIISPGDPELVADAQLSALDREFAFSASAQLALPAPYRLADYVDLPETLSDLVLDAPLTLSIDGNRLAQQFNAHTVASGLGYQAMDILVVGAMQQSQIKIDSLQLKDAAGNNQLRGTGEITLAQELQWSLVLDSPGVDLPKIAPQAQGRLHGSVQVNGKLQDDNWQVAVVDVNLQGDVNGMPASISGFGGMGGAGLVGNTDFKAEVNGAKLLLQSSSDPGQSGHLELQVADLGRWQTDARGQLTLQAVLASDQQQLHVSGTLQKAQWGALQVAQVKISGDYDIAAGQQFNLDAELNNVVIAELQLTELQLQARGTPAQHGLSLISAGDVKGDLAVNGAWLGEQWSGSLAPTQLQTQYGNWDLSDSVAASWSNVTQQLAVAAHCWRQQKTSICLGESQLGTQGKSSVDIVGDLALLAVLLPYNIDMQGDLALQLDASWSPAAQAVVTGRAQTHSLIFTQYQSEGEFASVGWDKGDASFSYDSTGLNTVLALHRDGRRTLGLEFFLPPGRDDQL